MIPRWEYEDAEDGDFDLESWNDEFPDPVALDGLLLEAQRLGLDGYGE